MQICTFELNIIKIVITTFALGLDKWLIHKYLGFLPTKVTQTCDPQQLLENNVQIFYTHYIFFDHL